MKFCKVADVADWQNEEFQAVASMLGFTQKDRKSWEFIQVYLGLKHLGLLNGQAHTIGLGVGHEPLIFAFTNTCEAVVATDLYDSENWSTAAMSTQEVYNKNPFPYHPERLTVRHMDMTQVEYPDESFDFVWSCCSIEHVNNFKDLHKVYQEIHRILKPGGIAALTTEFNPTDLHSYEPNMLFTDRYWIEHWLTGEKPLVQGFELLDPPNWTLSDYPENQPMPRIGPGGCIQVHTKDVVLNSISFFLRKAGAFSQPYDERWLDPKINTYFTACDAYRTGDYAQAETLLTQLMQDTSLPARFKMGIRHRLAATLDAQGKPEAVAEVCKDAIPDHAAVSCSDHLTPLAMYCKKVGLWQEANTLYQRIEHLPGAHGNQIVASLIGQAQYLGRTEAYEAALALIDRADETATTLPGIEPDHRIYFHRGLYSEKLGLIETAIAAYRQTLTLADPTSKFYENCNNRLSKCLERQERIQARQSANAAKPSPSPAPEPPQTSLQKLRSKLSGLKKLLSSGSNS
jgi:SAM-dependent methyltransferase